MGELVKKTSTGIVPIEGGENYTFATRWQYDSWNRIRTILYPDGELVEYNYDNGGQLISMQGNKASTQSYVNNIEYDEFGSRTYFEYGNGVSSSYTYNTATRRLQNLSTTATNGNLHNITYTYDPVGNITRISNSAGGADGLGGSFTYNYSYDDLYRLDTSDGTSAAGAAYTLAMEYSPSGNILKKTQASTTMILGNGGGQIYENEYSYSGAHTLDQLFEANELTPDLQFAFDANGNMTSQQMYGESMGGLNERYLCWDEENRLSATRDNNYVTANIYDASGNRAWKLAGEMNWMWQNGIGWQGYGDLNLRTWYQSDLMTINDVGFTKHYFIAGQKIASKLGEGLPTHPELPQLKDKPLAPINGDYRALAEEQTNRFRRDFECLGVIYDYFSPGEGYLQVLDEFEGSEGGEESDVYFYHSDHLGSSSFLTDINGYATQHLQYMPFGEDLVHQQNTAAYYTPYTFSGKERDMETGLSYFGARYYDAGLSIWLSVDPMADKYPSLSSYNYCAWNPVMLVDPDGQQIAWPGVTTYYAEFRGAVGLGMGVNAIRQSGVARDEVGYTHFISQSNITVGSSSTEVMSGLMVSVMGGVSQDWGNETFLGQLLNSNGGEFSASMAYGVSAGFSVGKSKLSLTLGIGVGAEVVVGQTKIVESISLTTKESNVVSKQARKENTWSVTNMETLQDGTLKASVAVGTGKDQRVTSQVVYSTDGVIWMSKDYKQNATQLEGQ